jgi:UDP-4-amino-4-deoxy-L-arabinose formyltransferase/UDP-glucuronic acid dehydrogenase (UDP-4-keto-hexauronic acid decarboxylating)
VVDGGEQRRCYTWIGDGIGALMEILVNEGRRCDGEVINIGNPANDCSVAELAQTLSELYVERRDSLPDFAAPRLEQVSSEQYYGAGYEDVANRKPDIRKAQALLEWSPRVGLREALALTFDSFLAEHLEDTPANRGDARSVVG